MKQHQDKIDFAQYFDILRRRKWYIIPTFFAICIAGLAHCLTTPPVYRASTTIAVDRQKVPEAFIRPTVTAGIDERLQSIGEGLMSRTNLERVISRLNLYPEERKRRLPVELIIEKMRQEIHIDISKRGTAFTISFESTNPALVAPVADFLASMFMEENLKLREERSKGTSEFLAQELQQLEKQLKEREAIVSRYKMSHMGELPTQTQANLAVLQGLQQQLEGVQESIRRAQESKILIQQKMQDAGSNSQVQIVDDSPAGVRDVPLEQMKRNLAGLEAKYKPEHPDVLKAKLMIRKMEETPAAKSGGKEPEKKNEKVSSSNPFATGFQGQLSSIDMEIRALKAEATGLKQKMSIYQSRVENTPRREQEIMDLQRDYNNMSSSYQQLLAKKSEAERAENLERKQKGEQFRVVDPARAPEMPFKPNIPRELAVTFIAALAVSVGLALGREYIDKSLYRMEDVESFLKLPVLARIPILATKGDIKKRRTKTVMAFGTVILGFMAISTLLVAIIQKYPRLLTLYI